LLSFYEMSQLLLAVLLLNLALATANGGTPGDAKLIERGRYLTVEMGKCGDCHTPRLPNGAPDTGHSLKGATLGVKPLGPVPGWASVSPDLTSTGPLWKSWGDQALTAFFTTGRGPDGKRAAPPMPAYTLTSEDARAIVAYLRSLR
jgi:mono/diheme cytochrome c family protein